MSKPCIDCCVEGITTKRKPALDKTGAQVPGGRCVTHERAKKKERRTAAREKRWEKTYAITAGEYWAILEEQDGHCYICQRATGASKALAVDHDHKTGQVRGILCGRCNADILGHGRDDIEFFERAIEYLKSPPALRVIGVRIVPDHVPEE